MTITVVIETWGMHTAEVTTTDTATDGSQLVSTETVTGMAPHRLTVWPGRSITISEPGAAKDATEIDPPPEPAA